MTLNLEKSITRSQQLHVDRKMIGILSIFTLLGICLVITLVLATNTLSALRAFATMQTNWTEARKEAAFHLINFIETEGPEHFARFDSSMHLIRRSSDILEELRKPDSDRNLIEEKLLAVHTAPADIPKMITTFEWFHNFRDFSKAVTLWDVSDEIVYQMEDIAEDVQNFITESALSGTNQTRLIEQVLNIDRQLREKQLGISISLASGTQLLNSIVVWVSSTLGLILLLIGGILSFKFLKSVKKWQLALEMNEQQFRSLFEQNPNAVYSLTKEGKFVTGNKALEKMIGYPLEKLSGAKFDKLFSRSGSEEVKDHFKKASLGESQTYETVGKRGSGEEINLEITKIPIYVKGEVEGVFGIVHDITERKEAERKIQEQLEEKTHLLAEVHDRVKNNLAIMSGLIELEREFNDLNNPKYLDNTISRIQSMAMVHERLYHTETFSSIRIDKYVSELSKSVKEKSNFNNDNFKIHLQTEPVALSIKQAIPTALILNEVLMNVFTHAFIGKKDGNVIVSLAQSERDVLISIEDDGVGFPEKLDLKNPTTLGLKLIILLSEQLEANIKIKNNQGTHVSLQFEDKKNMINPQHS